VILTRVSPSWYVWTGLVVAMLLVFGPRHPPTADEHLPLDRVRVGIAALALIIFAMCFTPAPIEVIELLPR
jgi:hypothetical protein